MAKKLISVWLSMTIVLFSTILIYAEENVQGDFFNKKVVVNGNEIVNYHLQYPFFTYNGTTYIPLTESIGEIFGFEATMDWESRTLKLLKTEAIRTTLPENWTKNNGYDQIFQVADQVKILAYEENDSLGNDTKEKNIVTESEKAQTTDENVENEDDSEGFEEMEGDIIKAPEMSVEAIKPEGMEVLVSGKYTFIPLRTFQESDIFGWNIAFDPYFGVAVSTEENVPAESFISTAEIQYNRGLVDYIMYRNGGVTAGMAQELVFLFKRAAEVNNVDEKLLMAVAEKESTFNSKAVSSAGARGLMQVMPTTGANFGVSLDQLFEPQVSINIGAFMISSGTANYGGDTVKALSAYNQGPSRVNRGTHSTAYATRILSAYDSINNYMQMNGYMVQ